MSYVDMDHAGWVEECIASGRRRGEPKVRKDKYGQTVGWAAAPEKLTPFQRRAFDILGMFGGGIYNAPIAWDSVNWHCSDGLSIPLRHANLSTFDFEALTRLVFLCHEARIRCDIQANGPRGIRLLFHPRSHQGGMADRHPDLDEAVAAFRSYLPADHPIVYRPERDDPLPAKRAWWVEVCRKRLAEAADEVERQKAAERLAEAEKRLAEVAPKQNVGAAA